jgi:hypothetical protein
MGFLLLKNLRFVTVVVPVHLLKKANACKCAQFLAISGFTTIAGFVEKA